MSAQSSASEASIAREFPTRHSAGQRRSERSKSRGRPIRLLLMVLATLRVASGLEGAPQIDVRSFGAACDALVDDAPALQAAIDALPSARGAALLIPCRLAVGSTVTLASKSDVIIKASAPGAGLRAISAKGTGIPAAGPFLLVVKDCVRCTVKGLKIDIGNMAIGALGVTNSRNTKIVDNTVHDVGSMSGGAISAAGNIGNQYVGNRVIGNGTTLDKANLPRGLWIGNYWPEVVEWYPVVQGNFVRESAATGIVVHGVGAVIKWNVVEFAAGAGIKFVPPPTPAGVSTLIEGNVLKNNLFSGLQIDDGHDVIVRQNLIKDNRSAGLYSMGAFANIVIEENAIRDNDIDCRTKGWQGGIIMHQGSNIAIRRNLIEDRRTGASRTQTNGLWLNAAQGAIRNVIIEHNIFRNHQFYGVYLGGSNRIDGISLSHNEFIGNSYNSVGVDSKTPGTAQTEICSRQGPCALRGNVLMLR